MKERFPDFCNVFSGEGSYRGVKSVSLRAVDDSLGLVFLTSVEIGVITAVSLEVRTVELIEPEPEASAF